MYGCRNTWTGLQYVCVWKYVYLIRLKNPSQVIRNDKKWKTCKIVGPYKAKKRGKNHPMVPPLDIFQGKNNNSSSLARRISTSRRSFFANLTTFERHSGLKKFSLLKIAILKMGWLSKFQSHRSWGDAHLNKCIIFAFFEFCFWSFRII